MLELKRRPDQFVRIGQSARLTVLELSRTEVRVELKVPGVVIVAPLQLGKVYEAEVDGHELQVHLKGIDLARDGSPGKGEALLGFEAPRELRIDRGEVRP